MPNPTTERQDSKHIAILAARNYLAGLGDGAAMDELFVVGLAIGDGLAIAEGFSIGEGLAIGLDDPLAALVLAVPFPGAGRSS